MDGGDVRFELIEETRSQTNLGDLRSGSAVNVERSFRVGDEVGGHLLSGHVSAAVTVDGVTVDGEHRTVTVLVPDSWMRYLVPKGFIALNGASLTIQELDRGASTVTVSLIPETLRRTTFASVAPGDRLNLEVDAQTQAVVEAVSALLPDLLDRHLAGSAAAAPDRGAGGT